MSNNILNAILEVAEVKEEDFGAGNNKLDFSKTIFENYDNTIKHIIDNMGLFDKDFHFIRNNDIQVVFTKMKVDPRFRKIFIQTMFSFITSVAVSWSNLAVTEYTIGGKPNEIPLTLESFLATLNKQMMQAAAQFRKVTGN